MFIRAYYSPRGKLKERNTKVKYFSRITLLEILELLLPSKKEDYCFTCKWKGFKTDFTLNCDFRRTTLYHIPEVLQNPFCWLESPAKFLFHLSLQLRKKQATVQSIKRIIS